MEIPSTDRKKALVVIDVQPAFIKPHNEHIVPNIVQLLEKVPYDLYVESLFHAEKDSLWDELQQWTCPLNKETRTVDLIADVLGGKRNLVKVLKDTRSVFKGKPSFMPILEANNITELHLVGTETNDCVFATALDAFDNGFVPFVIEECCESATKGLHELALKLLGQQAMTNNSCLTKTRSI